MNKIEGDSFRKNIKCFNLSF